MYYMRITGISNIINTYNVQKTAAVEAKKSIKNKDEINISETAKEYQIARKAVMQSSDIREDKINEIKNRIQAGTYKVDAKEISDKIVNTIFNPEI